MRMLIAAALLAAPTHFQDLQDLSRLPWFAPAPEGRVKVKDPAIGPIIDFHTHMALAFGPPMSVDLFKLQPSTEHPHGLSDRDFDSLFTVDRPIIFAFHGYPWLIHRLAYRRTNHRNLHVRGYKEKGNINTPLELAIQNQIDRFTLAMDVIDRVPRIRVAGAHAKEKFRNLQIECANYAYEHGVDKPEAANWKWPY